MNSNIPLPDHSVAPSKPSFLSSISTCSLLSYSTSGFSDGLLIDQRKPYFTSCASAQTHGWPQRPAPRPQPYLLDLKHIHAANYLPNSSAHLCRSQAQESIAPGPWRKEQGTPPTRSFTLHLLPAPCWVCTQCPGQRYCNRPIIKPGGDRGSRETQPDCTTLAQSL